MHADAAPLVAIGNLMTHRLITRDQACTGQPANTAAASYATSPKTS
jgi:hypothetical protein